MRTRRLAALTFPALLAACAGSTAPEPTPAPSPNRPAASTAVAIRRDWTTVVTVDRDDSLVITLPGGATQIQRQGHNARFLLTLTPGAIRVRLDNLTLRPALGDAANEVIGTIWTGRVNSNGRVDALQASRGTPLAEELGNTVRTMLPRLVSGIVRPNQSWTDSSSGPTRVDIFRTTEQRTSRWSSGDRTTRDGLTVIPIRLREDFEQLGRGSQSGRQMTMTAQGRRTGTYYLTLDGRVDTAVLQDSVAKLITIPESRQSVPTMQFVRTVLRYLAPTSGRGPS